jgi:hypothetical protein
LRLSELALRKAAGYSGYSLFLPQLSFSTSAVQALIVARPFLLRALKTFLPPGVAILALKPIFFFLLSLFG